MSIDFMSVMRDSNALLKEIVTFDLYAAIFKRSADVVTKLVCARRMARSLEVTRILVKDLCANRTDMEGLAKQSASERREAMLAIGQWLVSTETRDAVDSQLGFDGLCDLIGANLVHRAEAREMFESREVDALATVVFIFGLEDSANANAKRAPAWKDGPLFHAYMAAFHKVLLDNPGAFPSPFEPGQPFYGMPVRVMKADGVVYTKRPALVVHDRNGTTRTVERKLERIKP